MGLIRMTGTHTIEVSPDLAEIVFGVQTRDTNAKKAQKENTELSVAVREALAAAGLQEKDISTEGYNMYARQEHIPKPGRKDEYTVKNYTCVDNSVKVSTKNLDDVGTYITAAAEAGATNISSLDFTLSKELRARSEHQALEGAAKEATQKALIAAQALGKTLGELEVAYEGRAEMTAPRPKAYALAAAAPEGGRSAPISSGELKVTAQVTVEYTLK